MKSEGVEAANDEEGAECADRAPMQTCTSDCDREEGLSCLPCVNTAEKSCEEHCKLGDPFCNDGLVTCPLGPGIECPAVKLCQ